MAIAGYTKQVFNPSGAVSPESIIVGNGVSSVLSTLAFNLCGIDEAIMLEVPNYGMFESDLTYQNTIKLVHVQTDHIRDRFTAQCADKLVASYEMAFQGARERGIQVRAVLISNPCNPLGRCYSRLSLEKISRWCLKHGLHLVSDEIYALSSRASSGLDDFTSALSLQESEDVSSHIHVLSGASKDFCMGGLRLGWLITRNELVWQTVRRLWYAYSSLNITPLFFCCVQLTISIVPPRGWPLLPTRFSQNFYWIRTSLRSMHTRCSLD
jgi:aspartate/methionine/tyrosine aminotransferase